LFKGFLNTKNLCFKTQFYSHGQHWCFLNATLCKLTKLFRVTLLTAAFQIIASVEATLSWNW